MKAKLFILLLILSSTVFYSCYQKNNRGTFTIQGRLVTDCSNVPVPNYDLIFSVPKGYLNSSGKDIGECSTDSAGYFTVTCTNPGNYALELYHRDNPYSKGNPINHLGYFASEAGKTYNWGYIYNTVTQHAIIKINIQNTHKPTDTLLIGTQTQEIGFLAGDKRILYPMSGTSTQTYTVTYAGKTLPYSPYILIYYGIGRKDFDSAFYAYNANIPTPQYHVIKADAALCGYPDTTVVSIP